MTQPDSSYNDDLRLAHVLADSVDSLTMERFKALDLQVETKPDLSPVTDADKAAEEAIRGQLSRSRPERWWSSPDPSTHLVDFLRAFAVRLAYPSLISKSCEI